MRKRPREIWDALSPSQKAALCIHGGKMPPLWAHLNYTVASMRALRRKGLWGDDGLTRLGKRVLECAPD